VLLVAFGAVVPRSIAALFGGLASAASPPINTHVLLRTAIAETVIFVALGLFLRARGWTLARLGLVPAWRDAAAGVLLALAYYIGYAVLWNVTVSLWPRVGEVARATRLIAGTLQWPAVALISLVNPLFEEVFVCGYVVTALKPRAGATAAVNTSAGLRVFCHFYQGALGVLGIVPMALLFAYWYARTARLWPLIIAHAILDVIGFAAGH
jgi:uncharacterized protein